MADKAQSSVHLAAKKPSKANGEESAEAPTRIVGGHSAPSSREQPNAPVAILSASRNGCSFDNDGDADVIDNDGTWQRAHDDWDWGPLMDEVASCDDDPEP